MANPTISPLDLLPSTGHDTAPVGHTVAYWMGLLPTAVINGREVQCPVNQLDVAGLQFFIDQESLSKEDGETVRTKVIGNLAKAVERSHIERLLERLPNTFLRSRGHANEAADLHGDQPTELPRVRRNGHVVRVPTAAQIKDAEAAAKRDRDRGITTNRLERMRRRRALPTDIPAAHFVFMVPCEDQAHPERGHRRPKSVAELGVAWPGDEPTPRRGRPKGSKNKPKTPPEPADTGLGDIPEAT